MRTHREISTVSGHELQTITCCAGILTAVGREGDIFSICSSTGELVLHFLQVSCTASISRLLHRPLNIPTVGVRRKATGGVGRTLIVQAGKNTLYNEMLLLCCMGVKLGLSH
jgi:hypothetical protein